MKTEIWIVFIVLALVVGGLVGYYGLGESSVVGKATHYDNEKTCTADANCYWLENEQSCTCSRKPQV